MKSKIKKLIEESLKNYKIKTIKISNREYSLYIVPSLCDEDLNIFEGFLLAEPESKSELSYLKSKYKPPVSGYAPRIGLIFYERHLLIKDYRRNRHIIKTLHKINKTFINKLKKALTKPTEENFNKLFDRTDVIDEFYILFRKSREFLLKNISGIAEEEKREEFVDNFMMQMLTLWYLQEKGFFNNDTNYFITKFEELKQNKLFGNDFKSYYGFLTYFFEKISNNIGKQYYEDDKVGKVVVVGPAVFINGEQKKAISIPDKCFYKEGLTDALINTPPKKVSDDVPILNLFESRDWTEGNIDEFVLGAIFEKLMNYDERKKTGAYYTPEEITAYICKNTIEPYLVDRINEEFVENFENIEQVVENGDKEILLYLFEQLKEIKILDPAVGSGHFLESAINVLLSIYEKVWEKAREIGLSKGFTILTSNEKGEIEEIELLSIKDEGKFHLLVKFFIILSKNIYGVDINPSALKVARARLFLTLAKHFKAGKEKDIFVRFPNVHFNLRAGNSLIGYVKPEKEKLKPITIFDFINMEKVNYVVEKIKVVAELKPYLEKTAKDLQINGNIVREVETLNEILSRKSIDWGDFEKVLRTKEKLIRILIASLNSKYAVPLNELLREITDLFNQKLDEKFAEEHNIKLEDLKKIKIFHWFFEFPEVFLDRSGFDVVVGNPPYVSYGLRGTGKLTEFEKELLRRLFNSAEYKIATYPLFKERSIILSREKGYNSLIVPDSFLLGQYFSKIRRFILDNCEIKKLLFLTFKVFVGSTVGVSVIYIFRRNSDERQRINNNLKAELFKSLDDFSNNKSQRYQYSQSYFFKTDLNRFRLFFRREDFEIIDFVETLVKREYLGKIVKFSSGLIGKKGKEEITSKEKVNNKWHWGLISGEEINRYLLNKPGHFILYDTKLLKSGFKDAKYDEPKLLMRQTGDRLIVAYDNYNLLCLNNLHVGNLLRPSYSLKQILIMLNSKLMTYYYRKISLEEGRTMAQTDIETIEKLLIPKIPKISKEILSKNADYLLFLNATRERRKKFIEIIEFFDRQIADSLVYELYFKGKFHEDKIYQEPKEYLLSAVSKHLKSINYDQWAELYWKKQLEGSLTPEEEKELEEMEKENMKVIEQVYNSMNDDPEVQKLVEKIKSHKWVKIIEGE
ncbi:MAG: hypothetical protein PWQ85_1108 [Geotoga sp.]|nr:hypothetical protein [Geotoga sp.]